MGSKAGARAMLARRDTVRLTGSHAAPVVALAVFCLGLCAIVWIGVLVLFELDRRPVDGRGPWVTSSLAYATAGGMSLLILLAAVGLLRIMRRQVDAAEAAREREARYRATFDQASVGIAHTAMDGRFREVNERLCEMLGYSADEPPHRVDNPPVCLSHGGDPHQMDHAGALWLGGAGTVVRQ